MSDIPEWVEATDGTWLHGTTISYREKELGWSQVEARSRPVGLHRREDEDSIARRARADLLTPGKVQVLMRTYGVTYEEAKAHLQQQ